MVDQHAQKGGAFGDFRLLPTRCQAVHCDTAPAIEPTILTFIDIESGGYIFSFSAGSKKKFRRSQYEAFCVIHRSASRSSGSDICGPKVRWRQSPVALMLIHCYLQMGPPCSIHRVVTNPCRPRREIRSNIFVLLHLGAKHRRNSLPGSFRGRRSK